MTICLLIRHASFDFGHDHLAGRSEHALSASGRKQVQHLQSQLSRKADLLQSSPRRRCIETLARYSATHSLPISICEDLDEIDYGDWSGRSFADLEHDPLWRRWNAHREDVRPPSGETVAEAQQRILGHLDRVAEANPEATIAMATHAELIRAAILGCRALPLGAWAEVDVPHASITAIGVNRGVRRLLASEKAA
jgi:ribonuclease H / adenosylcobalamin/alpha-ribazole phosphatase